MSKRREKLKIKKKETETWALEEIKKGVEKLGKSFYSYKGS